MTNIILNAENEEVVQPQIENSAENEEITVPQDMSDDDFETYINSAKNGGVLGEVQATPHKTGQAEPASEEEEPFRVFKTQQEYQSTIDGIIGERLRKNRESMNTLDSLKQLSQSFYGGDDGDAAIKQLIDDLQSQNAEKKGITVDEYKEQSQNRIDAEKYRMQQQQQTAQTERIEQIKSRWQSESEELKKVIPDFDFQKAMQNKSFYDNIISGMSVSAAYLAVTKLDAVNNAKRRNIVQNGSIKGSGGKVESNPAAMSDTDFINYINKIKG